MIGVAGGPPPLKVHWDLILDEDNVKLSLEIVLWTIRVSRRIYQSLAHDGLLHMRIAFTTRVEIQPNNSF